MRTRAWWPNLFVAAALLAGALLVLPPAVSAAPAPAESATAPMPAWAHALAKTATYEAFASIDAFVVGTWWTGDATTGGGFAMLSTATSALAFYLHELAWNRLGPDPNEAEPVALGLWKTISYRMVSATRVLTITYLLTGNLLVSGTYVGVNTVVDALIFMANDLAWASLGPPVVHLGETDPP